MNEITRTVQQVYSPTFLDFSTNSHAAIDDDDFDSEDLEFKTTEPVFKDPEIPSVIPGVILGQPLDGEFDVEEDVNGET